MVTGRPRSISVVVITKDEAARLESCVRAVRPFADEVLVVDAQSRDGTGELARRLGCTVVENAWPGYGPQRNVGAERAAHDWILFVDADEIVGSELAGAIERWKHEQGGSAAACSVRRVGDFMGRWLEGRAERLVRLYDRRRCRVTDAAVHEVVDTGPHPVAELPGTLWHYGFRSLSDHVARFDRYTTLEAEAAWREGRRFRWRRLLLRPPARLAHGLVAERLHREGIAGLAVIALWVHYELMRELKLRELEWSQAGAPHAPAE